MPSDKNKQTSAEQAAQLTSITAISFSLTFVGVAVALLAGLLPARLDALGKSLDTGVVLLFLPLCALVFAITAEVVRAILKGPLRSSRRPTPPLSAWRPGHGEG